MNINAEDFGIEFDRIAKLSVGRDAVFCDGELRGGKLLNRVVGLFSVDRVQKAVAEGEHHFLPDRVFWNGEDRTEDNLLEVIEAFLKTRESSWPQLEETLRKNAVPNAPGDPLDLCPVTRTIIGRHRPLRGPGDLFPRLASGEPFEVFVSFASEDKALAQRVADRISATTKHSVFFSDVTIAGGAFADQIDRALDSAWAFVAVGSQLDHLHKSWVKYEWRNFHNDMNSGRKLPQSPFFAFISGIDPRDLPRPLREQQAVPADPINLAPALARLDEFVVRP